MDPKIAELIRRLDAMKNSPNVHEAATAAKKLQELLFKHNLQMQDVPEKQEGPEFVKIKFDLGEGRAVAWKRDLLNAVSRYNFSRSFYHHDVDARGHLHRVNWMWLLGQRHNVEVVQYLMSYLSGEIIRLSDVKYDEEGYGNKASWKTQFCYGAVQGVADVLRAQFEDNRTSNSMTMSLVVVKDKELTQFVQKSFGKLSSMNLSGRKDTDTFNRGREAGHNIQIRKGVETSSTRLLS